jgi:hypothetical protein
MKFKTISIILLFAVLWISIPCADVFASNSSYLKTVSFFGDSTTYGLVHYIVNNNGRHGTPVATLTRDQILVPPDGTFYLRNIPTAKIRFQGKDYSLTQGFQKAAPKILIVTVGVNGLPNWTEETFLMHYRRLIDLIHKASPQTQIVLQSVYPTAEKRATNLKSFTVDKIDRLNGWIQALAKEQSLPYLNTSSVLKGEDGWLIPSYHNGDGMHLNTAGFNAVLNYIISHPIEKGQ